MEKEIVGKDAYGEEIKVGRYLWAETDGADEKEYRVARDESGNAHIIGVDERTGADVSITPISEIENFVGISTQDGFPIYDQEVKTADVPVALVKKY